jgi:hypothetical protein
MDHSLYPDGTIWQRLSRQRIELIGHKLNPWSRYLLLLPLLLAIVLWAAALPTIDVRSMTDLGLLSVFPLAVYIAFGLLTIGFCVAVQRPQTPVWLLALYVIALVVIIHGTPNILYGTLRYSWAWKHIGIVDYIQRHGTVNPEIAALDAYHNWPGFFALNALLTEAAGFDSALAYAGWAPVFFNLLTGGALLLVLTTFTSDRRLIGLSLWIFFLSNWVGQDYFSPQAFSYFLYLLVIFICIKWFGFVTPRVRPLMSLQRLPFRMQVLIHRFVGDHAAISDAPAPAVSAPLQRVGLMMLVLLFFVAMTSSHQLTPFMTISTVALFVIFRRSTVRRLPVLMVIVLALWFLYGAEFFLLDRLSTIFSSVGQFASNVDANLVNVTQLSSGQRLVSLMGRALTAVVWLLALAGGLRRLRQGQRDWTPVIVLFSVVILPLINDYGGEILFRVYLFALPATAFFAAASIYPSRTSGAARRGAWVSAALSMILFTGFLFAYYGKDRHYYFTPQEVEAARYLYSTAPPNSLLIEGTRNYPTQFLNYENFTYVPIDREPRDSWQKVIDDPVTVLARWLDNDKYAATYLILTRSQKSEVDELSPLPPGSIDRIERALLNSPEFRIVYRNEDAIIFASAQVLGGTP